MPPNTLNTPRDVEFRSIKQLINRFNANRDTERDNLISTDDLDVPPWQRQIVWNSDDMGLLAYSILQQYPIGMMILWKKDNGIRVPIDGRQRLTAIRYFYEGNVAIPDWNGIPEEYRKAKFCLNDGDEENGYKLLTMAQREDFEDYEITIRQYDNISEAKAMDIFVKLQGGKSLTKTEIRAALGGRLSEFVTELTDPGRIEIDDYDEIIERSNHPFFQKINIKNVRKAHRNLCDILLHEYLYPNHDKHWSSLETMYYDKSTTLSEAEQDDFRRILGKFQRAVEYIEKGDKRILPQLRSTYLVLSYFKAWKEIDDNYNVPPNYSFLDFVREFEVQRTENPEDSPYINFSAALSNAGYAQNRIKIRHEILMSLILKKFPQITPKNSDRRYFNEVEKMAIWEKAGHQCEYEDENGQRCQETFPNFRDADADHIIKWCEDGPTSIENGRLLCQYHNRSNR